MTGGSKVIEKGDATVGDTTSAKGPNVGEPSITAADESIAPGVSPNHTVGPLGQTGLFMRRQFRRQSVAIPVIIVLQLSVAITVMFGYGYIIGDIGCRGSLYLLTTGPTLSILMLDFALTTQAVGTYQTEGSSGQILTLPLDRLAFVLGGLLVWDPIMLPGLIIGTDADILRFDVDLSITWRAIPDAMLVSIVTASVGYTAAILLKTRVVTPVGQLCTFISMIFALIIFPVERLPRWLQTMYQWLPFEPVAQIMRGGIASEDLSVSGCSWVTLVAWDVVGPLTVMTALRRRE